MHKAASQPASCMFESDTFCFQFNSISMHVQKYTTLCTWEQVYTYVRLWVRFSIDCTHKTFHHRRSNCLSFDFIVLAFHFPAHTFHQSFYMKRHSFIRQNNNLENMVNIDIFTIMLVACFYANKCKHIRVLFVWLFLSLFLCLCCENMVCIYLSINTNYVVV